MARHTSDEWRAVPQAGTDSWRIVDRHGAGVGITYLHRDTARQIVREHNMHARLVEACRKTLAGTRGHLIASSVQELSDLIAEAEKE